jgi:23S rRNA pseudouridine955/2504/2580 synthase
LHLVREVTIRRDDAGQRLDRFLRKLLPGSTLGNLFRLLRKGLVRVNGRRAEGDLRLAEGDRVEIRADVGGASAAPPGRPRAPGAAASRPLSVLFRDEHVLAVDKPPFVLVQPGEGGDDATLDTLVIDLIGPGDSLTFRPGLAHRLDRGTSGIVLFGLSAEGLRGLTEAFRRREVEKRYLALVEGSPAQDEFTVDLPLARDPSDESRGKKVKVSRGADAQPALTEFTVLGRDAGQALALVEARPRTGRTHQIRAHLRAARLPIAGDPTYGDPRSRARWEKSGLRRQFLHAWRIRLRHPVEAGRWIDVEAPLPPDLRKVLARTSLGAAVPGDRTGR